MKLNRHLCIHNFTLSLSMKVDINLVCPLDNLRSQLFFSSCYCFFFLAHSRLPLKLWQVYCTTFWMIFEVAINEGWWLCGIYISFSHACLDYELIVTIYSDSVVNRVCTITISHGLIFSCLFFWIQSYFIIYIATLKQQHFFRYQSEILLVDKQNYEPLHKMYHIWMVQSGCK